MIFRYLTVTFIGDALLPTHWSVSAWGVNAPWNPSDTSFASSDFVLNRVWALAAHTLEKGILDTCDNPQLFLCHQRTRMRNNHAFARLHSVRGRAWRAQRERLQYSCGHKLFGLFGHFPSRIHL